MSTLTPAVADAFGLLQMDLLRHLDAADFLALKNDEWTEADVDTARTLIPELVLVIRELLTDHEVRPDGACQICTSVWPCPVVTLMHGLIKDPKHTYIALADRVYGAQ
ncbi:MAG: hypothetical protein ACRDRP_17595 [Pseudonocardiaceae bacterium]